MIGQYRTFTAARAALRAAMLTRAIDVHPKTWQGIEVAHRPEMRSQELLMESVTIDLGGNTDIDYWRHDIKPNLPWADDHFEERVCGYPINPGVEWENWPWATSADKHRDELGEFNHNYMERLWPRYAGRSPDATKTAEEYRDRLEQWLTPEPLPPRWGIRGEYGDLKRLVEKLAHDPHSRQIVIPLYFPEDTGASGRMPCTLLYQFIRRDDRLHMYYPLRSCDFIRHWADDCYMAVRLLLWVLDKCVHYNEADWRNVTPGIYHMHMTSLHVFENDRRLL